MQTNTLDHLIAVAERNGGRVTLKGGKTMTLQQLRQQRPPTFPLPPFTSQQAFQSAHSSKTHATQMDMLFKAFIKAYRIHS